MQTAGIEGQQVVLLLEDHQFVDAQFLELTNSLLSAGEVPGLYTPEELEPLLAPLKDQASDAGFRGTIAQYFASRMYKTTAHLKQARGQEARGSTARCQIRVPHQLKYYLHFLRRELL